MPEPSKRDAPASPPRRLRPPRLIASLSLLAAALAVIAAPHTARAQSPSVTGTYSLSGGLYSYNLSVTNPTNFIIADLNFQLPASSLSLQNPVAPTGFQIAFDPGSGFVDLLADSNPATPQDFFAHSTVPGFSFKSPTLITNPAFSTFNGLLDNGNSFSGTFALTQVAPAAAPEPSAFALVLAAAPCAGLLGRGLRRRRTA